MPTREVRITLGWGDIDLAVDRETAGELAALVPPGALHVRGPGGQRLPILSLRVDPRPSSHAAFIAVIEVP